MTIKLSFCIPTLNRGDYIGDTLKSIINQATEAVEIIVVDGGSIDNTETIVREHQKNFLNLTYFKTKFCTKNFENKIQASNRGFDVDCNKAVEIAKGEYCWILPDDDILGPNAVTEIIEKLYSNYSLIIVNSKIMDLDLLHEIKNPILNIKKDKIFKKNQMNVFFSEMITYMSYVGCVIIKRSLWLEREKEKYFGKGFIHLGVIFQNPLPNSVLVVAHPHIAIRYGNALWSKRAFEIAMINWPEIINSFECIPEKIKANFNMSSPSKKIKATVMCRAKGQYSFVEYKKWLIFGNSSFLFKVLAFLISVIPKHCINFLVLIYLKVMDRNNYVAIYDIEHSQFNLFKRVSFKNVS